MQKTPPWEQKIVGSSLSISCFDGQYLQVSQTTVPYIDAQPVAPQAASWLSGVGLYHKGTPGYGGYVGVMIKTYDSARHLIPKKINNKEKYILSK